VDADGQELISQPPRQINAVDATHGEGAHKFSHGTPLGQHAKQIRDAKLRFVPPNQRLQPVLPYSVALAACNGQFIRSCGNLG
jgi:hypothetical protein